MEHDTQKHVFFWVLSIGYIYLLRKASLLKGYGVYVRIVEQKILTIIILAGRRN
jgi:hypothetical protein